MYPHAALKELQDTNQFTELMVRQEELKTLPFGEVWDEYCRRNGVPVDGAWFEEVKTTSRMCCASAFENREVFEDGYSGY